MEKQKTKKDTRPPDSSSEESDSSSDEGGRQLGGAPARTGPWAPSLSRALLRNVREGSPLDEEVARAYKILEGTWNAAIVMALRDIALQRGRRLSGHVLAPIWEAQAAQRERDALEEQYKYVSKRQKQKFRQEHPGLHRAFRNFGKEQ